MSPLHLGGRLSPRGLALKRACRALVEAAGGIEAAALMCRLGKSQIGDCISVNHPERWLPADVVASLEDCTLGTPGWPQVTRHLARNAGLAVALLPVDGAPAFVGAAELGAMAKEAGEALSRVAQAVAVGGCVTADEVRGLGLIKEIDEALAAMLRVRDGCVAILEGE